MAWISCLVSVLSVFSRVIDSFCLELGGSWYIYLFTFVKAAFTVVKEKKSLTGFPVAKEKEMKAVDSSTTFENSSSVEPVTTESGQPEKMDVSSPKLENESKSNADLCEHSRAVGVDSKVAVSGSMEMQDDPKPSNGLDDGVVKPVSSDDQSSVPRLDFDIQDLTATKE